MSENDVRIAAPAAAAGVLAVVVLAALSMTASGLVDTRAVPVPPSPTVTQVPIQQRDLVCPDFSATGKSVVDVASQGTGSGSLAAGLNKLQDLPSTAGVFTVGNDADSGIRVSASGSPAQGLLAIRQDSSTDTSASAHCIEPQAEWWFAGGGASVAHRSFLILRNLDPGDAALQLRVFTKQGEVEPVVDAQVIVPGDSQKRIDLSLLTSIKDELTVSVVAERGLVAASMHDSITPAADAPASEVSGESWVSGQSAPQRTLLFPGDVGNDKSDELVITNTGGQSATVRVEVASANGWFAPQDVPSFTLGAGQVTNVDLAGVLDGGESAVRVVSTRPMVGILRRGSGSDMTESAPAPELSAPSAAIVTDGKSARLVVVGGPKGGAGTLVFSGAGGRGVQSRQISLRDGETMVLDVPDGARRVDLTPNDGSMYAAVTVRGPGVDCLAVRPLVLTVRQPNVTPAFH